MKGAGYVRVSSQEQISGTSLADQERQIRAYASMKGIDLIDVFIDAPASGGTSISSRPEGKKLVDLLNSGKAEALIIAKLDRGFRSASDCLLHVERWNKKGVSLHILNLGGQTLDTSGPTGWFFLTVMVATAELEKNMIRERCNAGRKARRLEGKRIGEVPYGFSLDVDGKTLLDDAGEQKTLTLILEFRQSGMSLRQISDELNHRGIAAKKGGRWTHGQVQAILRRAA
jgi:site-specific DNA recombinase